MYCILLDIYPILSDLIRSPLHEISILSDLQYPHMREKPPKIGVFLSEISEKSSEIEDL